MKSKMVSELSDVREKGRKVKEASSNSNYHVCCLIKCMCYHALFNFLFFLIYFRNKAKQSTCPN